MSECGLEARVEMACAAETALGRYSGDRFGRVGYPPDRFVQANAVYLLLQCPSQDKLSLCLKGAFGNADGASDGVDGHWCG